jgi:hypothetical protein
MISFESRHFARAQATLWGTIPRPRKQSDEDSVDHMNMKRMRGRNHRPNGGGGGGGGFRNQQNGIPLNRNHVFDSSGPEMRVRGTAQQLFEKYQQLARDASSNGDRVLGEAYYQHAEHYFRIISAINQAQGQPNGQPQQNGQPAGGPSGQPQQNGQSYQTNNGQDRGNYNQNGHNNGDYNRRTEPNAGDVSTEPQHEGRYEPRNQDYRGENRGESRGENREQPRRFENRPYEPRNKPEYQPRQDREPRNRPETLIPDPRIDISSALEAELAAATGDIEPAGYGEQPRLETPAIEARAIPIIPDAPPPIEAEPAAAEAEPHAAETETAVRKPRGRPRAAKPEAAELKLETPEAE